MRVRVECYAGYKADERPVRLHLAGRILEVLAVEDQWYAPDATWFRVTAAAAVYILKHSHAEDEWTIESFRRTA